MTNSLPKSNQTININCLQAVGSRHGPGQPEHLVLLAVLHNPSWLPSTGGRQGDCVCDIGYLTCWGARCSGWATTFRDLWDNIHCWLRSLKCKRQGKAGLDPTKDDFDLQEDCVGRRKLPLAQDHRSLLSGLHLAILLPPWPLLHFPF